MHKISLETLSEERLNKYVKQEIIDLGNQLYENGAVKVVEVTDLTAICTVNDIRNHRVEIKVAKKHLYLKCSCSYASRGLICEHEAAAWMGLREYLQKQIPPAWQSQLVQILHSIPASDLHGSNEEYLVFFSLQQNWTYLPGHWTIQPYFLLIANLPDSFFQATTSTLVSDIKTHIKTAQAPLLPIQKLTHPLDPAECLNDTPGVANIANLILERSKLASMDSDFPLHNYLSLLANTRNLLYKGSEEHPTLLPLRIIPEPGEFRLRLEKNNQGISIRPVLVAGRFGYNKSMKAVSIINDSPLWVLVNHHLISIPRHTALDLVSKFDQTNGIFIEKNQVENFQEKYFLKLSKKIPIDSKLIQREQIDEDKLIKRVYLDDVKGELQAQLRFGYGDYEVSYHPDLPPETLLQEPGTWTLIIIKRLPNQEQAAFSQLSSNTFGLKRIPSASPPGTLRLRARTHPVDFLLNTLPLLAKHGFEIFGEEELKTARVNRNKPHISFDVSSSIDWFDVKTIISFGELEVGIKDIRKAIQKKQNFLKLPDGSIGEIPEEWFERYKHLFKLGKTKDENLRFSHQQLTILDFILSREKKIKTDQKYQEFRQNLERLRSFQSIKDHPLPEGFTGDLRPYQKAGFNWLHFLREFNFGGCLADDMGLGKTIQTLAFLMSVYAEPQDDLPASLLIVPRSLLFNWQREVDHFTPNLRVLEYFDSSRVKDLHSFDQTDIVITTYGILLRDIEFLHGYKFHYAILDESQAIKNPSSQTARAAHLLDAQHKLVLTGTPIENSTSELWSQFTFINPGLLGTQRYFKTEFTTPIEKEGNQQVVDDLRKIIYPFILRRTKDQVAPELPPRSEKIIYCDMKPEQREFYTRTRDYFRALYLGMIESEGFDKSRFKILEGLLRLRQISNHPLLMDDSYQGASGKFSLLMDTLTTLKAEGHKALVFSQFVQMLKLVRTQLDLSEIPYTYLDGASQNRQSQVDTFQEQDEIPFFLISLKAGGLGLNLTAADYVIHIDPWWNPAVEMQASDRTHRIGQDKPVFIFKMITRHTVEEKILTLQERKRNLVDQIITTENSFFKSLSRDEIESLFSN